MTDTAPSSEDLPSTGADEFTPVGLHGLLASTERLLQLSRGLDKDDVRDSVRYKRFLTPAQLMSERVERDTGGVVRGILRHAAHHRSLKGFHPSALDALTEKFVVGNGQLVSPIEEINPMDIMGQSRRVTAMGPGGLGSKDAVTEGMQSVDSSQFGFISTIEGPESEAAGVDVRLAHGVKIGSNGRLYQRFRNPKTGNIHWMAPEDLAGKVVGLPNPV